ADKWQSHYQSWSRTHNSGDKVDNYPFVENTRSPFTPAHRALPMLNLAVITSAGAYIDGADPFDTNTPGGGLTFREIPTDIELADLRFTSRGYEPVFVTQDANVQIPLNRLSEFAANRIIGGLSSAFWSFSGFIPDAGRLVAEMLPKLTERLH